VGDKNWNISRVDLDRLLNSKLEANGISRQIEDMALRLTQAVVLQLYEDC